MAKERNFPGYSLSQEDRDQLQEIVQDWLRRNRSGDVPGEIEEGHQAPEVYVARIPSDGITSLTLSVSDVGSPGYGECDVYELTHDADGAVLTRVNDHSFRVYNVSSSSIVGDAWALVHRDKYGTWIISSSQGDGGYLVRCTGRGSLGLVPGVITEYNVSSSTWVDGNGVLIRSANAAPVLPGRTYKCDMGGVNAEGELVLIATNTPLQVRAQLVLKEYEGTCPVYTAVRVAATDACLYSGASTGPCLYPVYHERGLDIPVWPGPSPQSSTPSQAESSNALGGIAWTLPKRVRGSDNWQASCALENGEATQRLEATDFCFQIPEALNAVPAGTGTANDAVVVTNVTVQVECKASGSGIRDTEILLMIGGVPTGASQHIGSELAEVDTVLTYSASPATWGTSTDPADYNNLGFGVSVKYDKGAVGTGTDIGDDGSRTVEVDNITVELEFSPAGSYEPLSIVTLTIAESGEFFTFNDNPWVDLFRRNGASDADGQVAFHRRYNQGSMAWQDGREVRLILAE